MHREFTPDGAEHLVPVRALPIVGAVLATWAVVLADSMWLWGVVMIGWAIRDIAVTETRFIRQLSRRSQPTLYWLVVGSWLAMGLLWLGGS